MTTATPTDARNADRPPSYVEVETSHGRLRGRASDGIHVFKGIPYGASTAGDNRFMPPRPAAPWSGTRDALEFGQVAHACPSRPGTRPSTDA
ncbi:MAG: carboxylesterase family protein [Myxococcales bacterium]|nr:carboxylesterase family protein [Myxococcales bacterium]